MAIKATLVFCAFALLVQQAVNACGCGCGCGCGSGGRGASSSGGQFVVQSNSNGGIGIEVQSQNEYSGQLCLQGRLPFIGSVGIQGDCLPTCGSGQVCYDCGGCDIGIRERSCGGGCGCGCGGGW